MMYTVINKKTNTTMEISEAVLVRYFQLTSWDTKMVSSHDGDTYNPASIRSRGFRQREGKDFLPELRFNYTNTTVSHLPLRPLVIIDENGYRLSEEDIIHLIDDHPLVEYSPANNEPQTDSGFRVEPVPHTGKRRSMKCEYRSGDFFDEDYGIALIKHRSSRKDRSWKKDFKCRKAWGKHTGIDARKVSKRMEYLPDDYEDLSLVLDDWADIIPDDYDNLPTFNPAAYNDIYEFEMQFNQPSFGVA